MDLHALGRQAMAFHQQGRLTDAEPLYRQILAREPQLFPALCFLGVLRLQLGDTREAAELLGRALAINPGDPAAQLHFGLALQGEGRSADAVAHFDRFLAAHPGEALALMGRGAALQSLGKLDAALADYESVLVVDAGNADAWNSRGVLLRALRRIDEALDSFDQAIALLPDFAEALQNRGDLRWSEKLDHDGAVADLERALAISPDRALLRGSLLHLKLFAADWSGFDEQVTLIDQGVRAGQLVIHPFAYQAIMESPRDSQLCSRAYGRGRYPAQPLQLSRAQAREKIRLGYVSADFREHAVSLLMAGLFEQHDKTRFETVAFNTGGDSSDAMRQRVRAGFDRFLDISVLSDRDAAERIAREEIDILVTLNGYFGTEKLGVFAHRPAPVQVSYMGFPATLGLPYIDYVLADRIVVPPQERGFYDEKVVWLPETYWVNDNRRAIAAAPSRADCGLPETGFVFCNFNSGYKLTPHGFASWMRILRQTDGSVLWLFASNNRHFADNLRRHAEEAGIDPQRLVFAPLVRAEQHLARLQLADLSLDNLPYNAHTTAADALWAGVPIVTCRGTTWPGRVAASLLEAIALPELICENLTDYEALAVTLAQSPERLAALKAKLAANRLTKPLFDTARFARHMEAAYVEMIVRHRRGEAPAAFSVPVIG